MKTKAWTGWGVLLLVFLTLFVLLTIFIIGNPQAAELPFASPQSVGMS